MKRTMVIVSSVLLCTILASVALAATPKASSRLEGVVNINSATAEELQMLPGVGPGIAKDIVAYRQAKGPFKNITDLDKVKGIGKKKFEGIKPYCALEGKSTLKVMK